MTSRDEITRMAGAGSVLQELLGAGPHSAPTAARKPLSSLIENAFGPAEPASVPASEKPARPQTQPRRKIWELPAGRHCMLVGNCLSVAELRQLSNRAGVGTADISDYALHTLVVERCGERSEIAEAVQRLLDQRHNRLVRQFARARGGEAVLALWRDALTDGDVAGALWAAWTHPDTGEYEGVVIYGELHMLSHQLVERERSVRQRVGDLERQNSHLRGEAAGLRRVLADARQEGKQRIAELEERLAGHELLAARQAQDGVALERAKKIEIQNGALRERNDMLRRRLAELEQLSAEYEKRIAGLAKELASAHEAKRSEAVSASEVLQDFRADELVGQLAGRRILCIGGRTGLVDHYRRLVEAGGGHFLHHDGGQEESEHRIDAIVAVADAVVCQVSHVSHAAYWRIKHVCKQRKLPCVFLKSGGVTTFARNLAGLLAEQQGGVFPPSARGRFLARNLSPAP